MNKKLIIILGAFLLVNTITAKSHESLDQAIMNDIRNVLNERRLLFMHPYRLKRKDDGLARIQGKLCNLLYWSHKQAADVLRKLQEGLSISELEALVDIEDEILEKTPRQLLSEQEIESLIYDNPYVKKTHFDADEDELLYGLTQSLS